MPPRPLMVLMASARKPAKLPVISNTREKSNSMLVWPFLIAWWMRKEAVRQSSSERMLPCKSMRRQEPVSCIISNPWINTLTNEIRLAKRMSQVFFRMRAQTPLFQEQTYQKNNLCRYSVLSLMGFQESIRSLIFNFTLKHGHFNVEFFVKYDNVRIFTGG